MIPKTDTATFYFAAGATHTFGGQAAGVFGALRFDSTLPAPGDVETIYGDCLFDGKPYANGQYVGPGCAYVNRGYPFGRTSYEGMLNYGEPPSVGRYRGDWFGGGFYSSPPGQWTIGDYYLNAGPTTNVYLFFVFFNFDDVYTR